MKKDRITVHAAPRTSAERLHTYSTSMQSSGGGLVGLRYWRVEDKYLSQM